MIAPVTLVAGRYEVVRLIGQGGMGAVYEAFDRRLRTTIALKQIRFAGSLPARTVEREAQILAGLRHPALPVVTDCFTEEDAQFLVMQFIPGLNLLERLAGKPEGFAATDIVRWAGELLEVLNYLHKRTPPVIHGDIKPHNLKLSAEGALILLDFGLARHCADESHETSAGRIQGYSLPYAALEQLEGTTPDPRTDLYAFAATFYHLLTSAAPLPAAERAAARLRGLTDPLRPLQTCRPDFPPAASAILMQALELRPDKRPANAIVMQAALELRRTIVLPPTHPAPPLKTTEPAISQAALASPEASAGASTIQPVWQWVPWAWWVAFNSCGGAVGSILAGVMLLPSLEQLPLAMLEDGRWLVENSVGLLSIALESMTVACLIMATAQWLFLAATLRLNVVWVVATVLGMLLGIGVSAVFVGAVVTAVLASAGNSTQVVAVIAQSVLSIIAGFAIVSAVTAFIQTIVLRRALHYTSGWIVATTAGAVLATLLAPLAGMSTGLLLTGRLAWAAGLVTGGFVYGLLGSAITGIALIWLMQSARRVP